VILAAVVGNWRFWLSDLGGVRNLTVGNVKGSRVMSKLAKTKAQKHSKWREEISPLQRSVSVRCRAEVAITYTPTLLT
jgi:hypothetical protein